jgi:voltage-gated potassium channel
MKTLSPSRIWGVLAFAFVTLLLLGVPARLVLGSSFLAGTPLFDEVLTPLLLIDVIVRWRTAGSFRAYGWRWFLVDLVAAIPFGQLIPGTPFDMLRLVKVTRIVETMQQWWHSYISRWNSLRLLYSGYFIALLLHVLACGWVALRSTHVTLLSGENTYLRALYYCVTTLTSVGYGDITPQTNYEMLFAIAVMALGVGMFGYVIGNVAHIISNLHPSRARYVETMERINAFMDYRGLPRGLQERIREYHAYRWEKRLGFDESTIVDDFPPSLRAEVSLFLKKDVIEKVPFFKGAGTDLIRDIALAMRPEVYLPGDYIFHAGDQGQEMFFIGRGTVEVLGRDEQTVQATLKDGEFFGEVALVKGQPRNASVRAVGYCDLYALRKDTFDHVVAHHPGFKEHIDRMVTERFTRS